MTATPPTLEFRTRAEWREWCAAHNRESAGLRLVDGLFARDAGPHSPRQR